MCLFTRIAMSSLSMTTLVENFFHLEGERFEGAVGELGGGQHEVEHYLQQVR